MPGTAFGGTCYASQAEAAAMWCSATSGTVSGGVLSCQAVKTALPTTAGGPATFTWTKRFVPSSGTATSADVNGQNLPGCEPYDFEYFSPLLGAFIAASVAILCARWLHKLFAVDKEAL